MAPRLQTKLLGALDLSALRLAVAGDAVGRKV
jgi:hypothetical protein